MASYSIDLDTYKKENQVISFFITWTKDDGTVIGSHYHEVHGSDPDNGDPDYSEEEMDAQILEEELTKTLNALNG